MADTPIWSPTQQARLDQGRVPRSVDIHCHCLPGVDDGPDTLDDALNLCDALVTDGVTTVIATPHQLGSYDGVNTAELIREAVADLEAELTNAKIPLEILPGADVRVDERIVRLLAADKVLTAGDLGRHLLLELPHELFVDPLPAILALQEIGLQPIMTHPERHRYLANSGDRIAQWVAAGAVLQITAGSLLGDFGGLANQSAWRLVHAGLVSLVATDAHDARRRPPRMTAALASLEQEIGPAAAQLLCLENPLRVLHGEAIPAGPIG